MSNDLRNQNGSILVGSLLMLILLMGLASALAALVVATSISIQRSYQNIIATTQAEAAVEKTLWELNSDQPISCEPSCILENAEIVMQVNEIDEDNKEIITETYVPNMENYKSKKTIKVGVSTGPTEETLAIDHAVYAGDYGLNMYAFSRIYGNVYANGAINGYAFSRILGDAYATRNISSPRPRIDGQRYPNTASRGFPSVDIEYWEDQADINSDSHNGDYRISGRGSKTMGPKKIEGNLKMNVFSDLTLSGPLHITGDLTMNAFSTIYLDESFEGNGTVIIVDGNIKLNAFSRIRDGGSKGYLLLVSKSTDYVGIRLNAFSRGGVYYSAASRIQLNAHTRVRAVIGKGVIMHAFSRVEYEEGLSLVDFTGEAGEIWRRSSWQQLKNN